MEERSHCRGAAEQWRAKRAQGREMEWAPSAKSSAASSAARQPWPPSSTPRFHWLNGRRHGLATRPACGGVAGGRPPHSRAGAVGPPAAFSSPQRCPSQPSPLHPSLSLSINSPQLSLSSAPLLLSPRRRRHRADPPPPDHRRGRPAPRLGGRRPERLAQGVRRLHGRGPRPGPRRCGRALGHPGPLGAAGPVRGGQ